MIRWFELGVWIQEGRNIFTRILRLLIAALGGSALALLNIVPRYFIRRKRMAELKHEGQRIGLELRR